MWTHNHVLADFHIEAVWHDPDTLRPPKVIASLDCLHHGSIHFHDEIKYPTHETRIPYAPLRGIEDVYANFDTALDAFIAFADTIARREGMTR